MQIIAQGYLSRQDSNAIRKVFVSPQRVEGFSKCSAVINFLFIGAASLGLSALQNAAGAGKVDFESYFKLNLLFVSKRKFRFSQ